MTNRHSPQTIHGAQLDLYADGQLRVARDCIEAALYGEYPEFDWSEVHAAALVVEAADRVLRRSLTTARQRGLSYAQIADVLGVSRQAVHARMTRAHRRGARPHQVEQLFSA